MIYVARTHIFFWRIWSAIRKVSVQRGVSSVSERHFIGLGCENFQGWFLVSESSQDHREAKTPIVHIRFRPPVKVQQPLKRNKPSLEAITDQYKSSQKFCAQSSTPFWVKRTPFFWTMIKDSEERPVWELRPYFCGLLATDELVYEAHQKFCDVPVLAGRAELNDCNTKCLQCELWTFCDMNEFSWGFFLPFFLIFGKKLM